MINYKGTALITGASSGIGETFAKTLAARGMRVVLAARSLDKLQALAQELTGKYGVQADVIEVDLAEPNGAQYLFHTTESRGIHVTMLINNAGFATHGHFETRELAREQEQIILNVYALTTLTRLYLPKLLVQSGSAIINVASTAAFQALPFMAVYGASKAFVLSFSEALWGELKGSNVSMLAFCPGPVETQFAAVVGAPEAMVGKPDAPEFVVLKALQALEKKKSILIPRFSQYLLAGLGRLLPRQTVINISRGLLLPKAKMAVLEPNGN
ncbi:SDR family NAD(P)-dependent oxidoreductase [Glaciimonas soli]|uniref:SDR family NAD(P)-dependent oxidoreductase n=1 Tax=Glaciimonas soli TaxID=2590999 RepID=A0A843YP99_9BURK|nr:SDR family oxidoreductase [Glaciimonas soli]MQQ99806.1 SDR family NAD(P)-dependent oxidoreductase [Glaciimonas soli]